ncbi:SAM-dependent methyltransferase [uncultured Methanobrevibacter sp.]|uniref:SAM-dependent methyltransferase n=1 Tax=uncultured Methanobrevibacter sp. TaxID=253161 RepID=UPI00261707DF|nr:SAM-dependent methyltransferase [uncultured Methanobrevibacter sp.]
MNQKCTCGNNCIITKENLAKRTLNLKPCKKCEDITIKKFSPINQVIDLDMIDSNYKKCECGKRPLDIVMTHILKIMIEEEIIPQDATLRRHSPIPLPSFYYSHEVEQFVGKDSLVLIHQNFNKKVADRLVNEVNEVKCVLKGNPNKINGMINKNSSIQNFELLSGCDKRADVMRTLIKNDDGNLEKIIINKNQHLHHIEVAPTTEEKLIKLHNYLENNNVKKGVAIDGMCGNGSIGIYLLKYGFEKVIFNDIYSEAIDNLKFNLEINEIIGNYEIYNKAFEDLNIEKCDFCVIDSYPQTDLEEIIKKAEKIADNILII